jgi:hypothetical protein
VIWGLGLFALLAWVLAVSVLIVRATPAEPRQGP